MSELARFELAWRGEVRVARLTGEIDRSNSVELRSALLDAMPNDAAGLALDLAAVSYLDSAGIDLLFELARRLGERRQQLRVALPPGAPIERVLELTRLETVAPVHPGLDEAVAAINPG